jgi:LacI family transcriptional regulator
MPRQPKVALLIETSNAYTRGMLQGIEAYIREHRQWSIYLSEHGRGDRPPPWLAKWDGQGIIARIENKAIASALAHLTVPVVDVSAARLLPELPWLETDDHAISKLAVEHFLERGFRKFAFCGDHRFNWSNWRQEKFAQLIREAGYPCFEWPRHKPDNEEEETERIGTWLAKLPKPLAVFSCYDARGRQVLDACRRLNLAVPEEVAVLGVDNDEVLCELSHPPLSSVIPNTRRTGYEAAALLDQMMRGQREQPIAHLIPPIGIATRQSSDITAVDDTQIARAARYIREHACQGIGVEDVLRAVPMSRRLLESRFRKLIGRTPNEEITRVQLNRVRELLTATDLPLVEIASRAGFQHAEYLSVVFKKKVGVPPRVFRAEHRKSRS